MKDQVDPQNVKNFLDAPPAIPTPGQPAEDAGTVTLDELKQQMEERAAEDKFTQEQVEAQRNKTFEPDKNNLVNMSAWVFNRDDLKVEVNDMDKRMYLKALLNDTPIVLNIAMECGLTISFKPMTNYEMEAVFLALQEDSNSGKIIGPSHYAARVQQYAAVLQLLTYNDIAAGHPVFSAPYPPIADTVLKIRECLETKVAMMGWPKWQAVVTGLRIFETKLAICNENMRNGNFWNPAE